jgi:hypothetical protein
MNMRKFGGFGLAALALAIASLVMFAQRGQTQEKETPHMEHSKMMLACAKACSDCQRACDSCATHCTLLLAEGKKEHMKSLRSCQDCATICAASSQIVARNGPTSVLMCECCAKACDLCGKSCEAFPEDKHMKSCAEECRRCETACKAMVKHMAGG